MSTESRKRPESSSPEKLKARNKDKFRESAIAEPAKQQKEEEEVDEAYEEEEFEKMLDKNGDDGDESDQVEGVRITENDH